MGEYINSKQARFDKSFVSCGVVEVHHLPDGSPIDTVFAIANHMYNKANGRPGAFIVFSDTVDKRESRGQLLADEIKKLNMGSVYESVRAVNPKTGHTIRLWVWAVNHDSFRKWYTEEYANRISEN